MRPKHIKELVKIVEESNISELVITRWWGNNVRIRKVSYETSVLATPPLAASVSVSSEPPPILPSMIEPPPSVVVTQTLKSSNNLVEIKSPMVGTFYRAPSPEATPYVEVGDMVSPGKVLCIIEAMKLMNEIEAEISGKIVEILIENAQPVEYNQVLFKVQK